MVLQHVAMPVLYRYFCMRYKIDDNLIVFADAHSNKLPYSMQYVYRELSHMGYRTEKHLADFSTTGTVEKVKAITHFARSYAQARCVIICSYYLPVSSARKRKGTTVVQLWHASGTWKKIGYDSPEDIPHLSVGNQTKNYDLVTVSSPALIPYYRSAFRLPEGAAVATGISRTDIFFEPSYIADCKALWLEKYPHLADKKIALWAPTFRGKAPHRYTAGIDSMMELNLPDDWILASKIHVSAPDSTDMFQPDIPAEKLLPIVDVVITDFSTIIFEAALLKKPVILFQPEKESYEQNRGVYFPTSEVPVPLTGDNSTLAQAIIKAEQDYDRAKWIEFSAKYMSACDGYATERIIKRIFA